MGNWDGLVIGHSEGNLCLKPPLPYDAQKWIEGQWEPFRPNFFWLSWHWARIWTQNWLHLCLRSIHCVSLNWQSCCSLTFRIRYRCYWLRFEREVGRWIRGRIRNRVLWIEAYWSFGVFGRFMQCRRYQALLRPGRQRQRAWWVSWEVSGKIRNYKLPSNNLPASID